MIKNFKEYSKQQNFANNTTQWKKEYSDGGVAYLVIDDNRITRKKVESAFYEQEQRNKHIYNNI